MATEATEDIDMRINDIAQPPIGSSPAPGARGVAGGRPGSGSDGSNNRSDEVNLSDRALLLHKAEAALSAAPEATLRSASRLDAVRRQLEDGSYRIPLDELAAKLLKLLR